MLMMKIRMNEQPRYSIAAMSRSIDSAFAQMGLLKNETAVDALTYQGSGSERDYGRFGRVVNTLKKQAWFMENVAFWRMYDSDDSENPNDYNEEDLLLHYQNKRCAGA